MDQKVLYNLKYIVIIVSVDEDNAHSIDIHIPQDGKDSDSMGPPMTLQIPSDRFLMANITGDILGSN